METRFQSAAFERHVALPFQLYAGLFQTLPWAETSLAGTLLPLFLRDCREGLKAGDSPQAILARFFDGRLGLKNRQDWYELLFGIARLIERQGVLFDALEEASFHETHQLDGPGSLRDVLNRLEREEKTPALAGILGQTSVRIVLTAHPTQFYTEHVLTILRDLGDAIHRNDTEGVHRLLLQMGRTKFKKRERPTPYDEARNVLSFLEHGLYREIPAVHLQVLEAAGHAVGTKALAGANAAEATQAFNLAPTIEVGFWPGGDRDGNPFVDAATTRRVATLLHECLMESYLGDLRQLQRHMTFDGVVERLATAIERLEGRIKVSLPLLSSGEVCLDPDAPFYASPQELQADLLEVRRRVLEEFGGLSIAELDRLLAAVACFGFHFASLDLRQDSRVLSLAAGHVLAVLNPNLAPTPEAWAAQSAEQRFAALSSLDLSTLHGQLGPILAGIADPVLRDCLEMFAAAREIRLRSGEATIHRVIISNTRSAANILEVILLEALATPAQTGTDLPPLDVVPLFETVDDLAGAATIMEALWAYPAYRHRLAARRQTQHIMLGFSDGTKDGGYMTANWYIYKAKQELSAQARKAGLSLVFFDGRGGPPGRGGGNTHKFYRSLGPEIESQKVHLTVQGQTISAYFGHPLVARWNLETLLSAVLENQLEPPEGSILSPADRALLQGLSDRSYQAYQSLRDDPDFLAYLQEFSPLPFYSQANNSSRPAKRAGSTLTLDSLRAIPFVGGWSLLKQNVPGFFGFGTAIKLMAEAGQLADLQKLYHSSLFFRTLCDNSMQSLTKTRLDLTSYIARDSRFGRLWQRIADEVNLTTKYLLELSGDRFLLEHDPVTRDSIALREELTLPLSVIQHWALGELRQARTAVAAPDEALEKLVVKTMAACINASRNSV